MEKDIRYMILKEIYEKLQLTFPLSAQELSLFTKLDKMQQQKFFRVIEQLSKEGLFEAKSIGADAGITEISILRITLKGHNLLAIS